MKQLVLAALLVALNGLAALAQAVPSPASPACGLLAGPADAANPATVWLGLVSDFSSRPIRLLAADLARREISGVGLPPDAPNHLRRPLGIVACNSTKGIDGIFRHLIQLGVPAVIGPDKSAEALYALTTYTLPAGMVMVGNNTTASVFTTLATNGLFLRLLASDAWQGKVDGLFIGQYLEKVLRARHVVGERDAMKLVILHKADVYGRGIFEILLSTLRVNGKSAEENGPNLSRIEYVNSDHPQIDEGTLKGQSIAAEIIAMRPHVIAFAGTTELLNIVKAVESSWPADLRYRPVWMGTDGAGVISVRNEVAEASFPQRLLATNLRLDFDGPIAQHVLSTMRTEHPEVLRNDPRSGTMLATYDAVYALAYAIASLGPRPLIGTTIATALRTLNRAGAKKVTVGPIGIQDIFARLERHEAVDLRGATGDLNWDANGDVTQDIDIVCVRQSEPDQGIAVSLGMKPSGLYYDVRHNRFRGEMTNCPAGGKE